MFRYRPAGPKHQMLWKSDVPKIHDTPKCAKLVYVCSAAQSIRHIAPEPSVSVSETIPRSSAMGKCPYTRPITIAHHARRFRYSGSSTAQWHGAAHFVRSLVHFGQQSGLSIRNQRIHNIIQITLHNL